MTIEEVKALLRINHTNDDAYLTAILPDLIEFVEIYCNRQFRDEDRNISLPGGLKLAIAKMCEHHMRESGVVSETLARHSVTYSTSGQGTCGYPGDIMTILRNYKWVKFV